MCLLLRFRAGVIMKAIMSYSRELLEQEMLVMLNLYDPFGSQVGLYKFNDSRLLSLDDILLSFNMVCLV